MIRSRLGLSGLLAAAVLTAGCLSTRPDSTFRDRDLERYQAQALEIDYADAAAPASDAGAINGPPVTLQQEGPIEHWDLTLEEAVQIALQNNQVLRDLGGAVLQNPASVRTIHGPAIAETDPRFGVAGALSAFDAAFATSVFFEDNDRRLNNPFFVGGGTFRQDLGNFDFSLSKVHAAGTQTTVRHTWDYDANNTPGNPVFNTWNVNLDLEVRQPLLQGAGVDFNRIAGPGATPGAYSGVLIARTNVDIELTQFEQGVQNLVSDVENAYWELYFSYRDLDAKLAARDLALETWRQIAALNAADRRGGEADKEAQARESYFRLDEEVQNALAGTLNQRTSTNTFQGNGGLHLNERRLRLMLGVAINDGRLIRPVSEPALARVQFAWEEVLAEALTRRVELRRTQWELRRRELEAQAARNFLLPQLDVIGRYRWRGLGRALAGGNGVPVNGIPSDAFADLFAGDFEEWQLGAEMRLPVGFRQAHAGLRNAELLVARSRAILQAQEREVVHDLSAALAEVDRAYQVAQTNYNRRLAAKQQLAAVEAVYKDAEASQQTALLAVLLDTQRRLSDAESRYYRSLTEYSLAVKLVHYHKGSLLDYNNVFLSEGPWPDKAYADAARRERLRFSEWRMTNFLLRQPPTVSAGQFPQLIEPAAQTLPPTAEGGEPLPVEFDYGAADAPAVPPILDASAPPPAIEPAGYGAHVPPASGLPAPERPLSEAPPSGAPPAGWLPSGPPSWAEAPRGPQFPLIPVRPDPAEAGSFAAEGLAAPSYAEPGRAFVPQPVLVESPLAPVVDAPPEGPAWEAPSSGPSGLPPVIYASPAAGASACAPPHRLPPVVEAGAGAAEGPGYPAAPVGYLPEPAPGGLPPIIPGDPHDSAWGRPADAPLPYREEPELPPVIDAAAYTPAP